jgi:hypothetical protein
MTLVFHWGNPDFRRFFHTQQRIVSHLANGFWALAKDTSRSAKDILLLATDFFVQQRMLWVPTT